MNTFKGILGCAVGMTVAFLIVNAIFMGAIAPYLAIAIFTLIVGSVVGGLIRLFFNDGKFAPVAGGAVITAALWVGALVAGAFFGGKLLPIVEAAITVAVMASVGAVGGFGYKLLAGAPKKNDFIGD